MMASLLVPKEDTEERVDLGPIPPLVLRASAPIMAGWGGGGAAPGLNLEIFPQRIK